MAPGDPGDPDGPRQPAHGNAPLPLHSNYRRPAYRVRQLDVYKVGEGFPRIVPADIMEGVGDVRYSVAVAGIGSFLIDDEELRSVLTEAGHG